MGSGYSECNCGFEISNSHSIHWFERSKSIMAIQNGSTYCIAHVQAHVWDLYEIYVIVGHSLGFSILEFSGYTN